MLSNLRTAFLRTSALHHLQKNRFSEWKSKLPKFTLSTEHNPEGLAHPIWSLEEAEHVKYTHNQPKEFRDKFAYGLMKFMRSSFDFVSGYKPGKMTESKYLTRFIFLETVAATPGMIGGMIRHLKSLRSFLVDGGWVHHLLEEAENERMHLYTFITLKEPSFLFKVAITASQFLFVTAFTALYVTSSKTAHRFVGYLEEEAVKTYSNCLKELDSGNLPLWSELSAPSVAISYWNLTSKAKFRDVLVAIRADEAMHREVNHYLADVDQKKVVTSTDPKREGQMVPKVVLEKST